MRITLHEYAKNVGRHPDTVRQKILRGKLNAIKMGGTWLIEDDEPYEDHRTQKYYRQSEYYKKRLANAEQNKAEKEKSE